MLKQITVTSSSTLSLSVVLTCHDVIPQHNDFILLSDDFMNFPSMKSCYESEGFTAFACSIEKMIVRTDNGYSSLVSDVSFSVAVKPLTDFHV